MTRPSLQDATRDRVNAAAPCCARHTLDVMPDTFANNLNGRLPTAVWPLPDSHGRRHPFSVYVAANASLETAGMLHLNNTADADTDLETGSALTFTHSNYIHHSYLSLLQ